MTFWNGLKYAYREGWAFCLTCPLLALVPVVFELVQHVIEMRIGMYEGRAGALAADGSTVRLWFGFLKTLALLLPGYWVVRYLAGGRDARAARTAEPAALRLFALVFIAQAAFVSLQIFLLSRDGAALAIGMLAQLLLFPLFARTFAAAPLGRGIGPLRSARAMLPQLPWSVMFSIAVMLPLMIPHYAFAGAAIFAPALWKWPILILDTLLVGWLAAVLVAGNWVIAVRRNPPPELDKMMPA